jgi:hypothetical protein
MTTCSLLAALSAEGRTNLTVAHVGVTDDTVTLVGAVNSDMAAVVRDASAAGGVEAALTQTASTRGAAMTAGAATQSFFMHLMMVPRRNIRGEVNQKFRQTFAISFQLS